MSAIYFFEVVWKVACLRNGSWQTGKCILRSAIREFSDSLFLFGPDLQEEEDPDVHPDLNELISWSEKNALHGLSSSRYCMLPEEPRIMVASQGRRIKERQTLYELWEDSGLHSLSAELLFIEPLIFCHAFQTLHKHTRDHLIFGTSAGSRDYECLAAQARLCVKKKTSRIETVLNTEARIIAKNGVTFGMNLYGSLRHTFVPEAKVQYAMLVPDAGERGGKPVSPAHRPFELRAKTDAAGSPGVTVKTPGEPGKDYRVLPLEQRERGAPRCLASGFLAHMTFYEEPSGLLWIF
ncbi:MAG: hypothetical protein A4E72_01168 [Syntrophus sp. PtaU1.Bin208]|nr:MAG: hypothetical protein A4E72_01168 [Syntrophus sp. PtaU1.Bin208]